MSLKINEILVEGYEKVIDGTNEATNLDRFSCQKYCLGKNKQFGNNLS